MTSYRLFMMRTLNTKLSEKEILTNAAMGLAGEAGEFVDQVKKHLFQGHKLDKEKLIKELGDLRWYMEAAAYALGTTVENVEEKNIQKLDARYPEGFSSEASVNRKE